MAFAGACAGDASPRGRGPGRSWTGAAGEGSGLGVTHSSTRRSTGSATRANDRPWLALGRESLPHLLRLPPEGTAPRGLLVSVHGISRNALEHAELLAEGAARHGLALLAPVFSRAAFPGYQRLVRGVDGRRPDGAFLDLLDWVRRGPVPVGAEQTVLVGYSGGAQFVHRFLLAHPGEAAGALLAAAGWYTWPDPQRKPPHGVAGLGEARLRAFLGRPIVVAVGSRDVERDPALRTGRRLDELQGSTRLERARRWVRAMRAAAEGRGQAAHVRLRLLAGARHSFAECMAAGLGDALEELLSWLRGRQQLVEESLP